ncbi:MAG: dockerin type I domain-containing protein, partial [Phycisphaerae bacterium]
RVNAIDLSYIWPRRTGQIDGVTVSQTRSDVTGDGRVNAIDLSATWPKRGPSMQDVLDPVLHPSSGGADLSQGALDAAAALWIARQEDTSPAPPDSAAQPADISLPPPPADIPLSAVPGSQDPADVLAAPLEDQVEDTVSPSPATDLDPDLLDVLSLSRLTAPLGG